jgi:hypothetical protein
MIFSIIPYPTKKNQHNYDKTNFCADKKTVTFVELTKRNGNIKQTIDHLQENK